MDQKTQMKVLLEAIDAPEVDHPKRSYANTPGEQTLDSATQQNFGRDLNKKKPKQFKYKPGDNSRAARMHEYRLEEDRLTKAFRKFKLNESADSWSKKREGAKLLDDAIKDAGLEWVISHEIFNMALNSIMDGDWDSACDIIMGEYSDHNGGEPRNWQAIADDLCDDLEYIVSSRIEKVKEEPVEVPVEQPIVEAGEDEWFDAAHSNVDMHLGDVAGDAEPDELYDIVWSLAHDGAMDQGATPDYASIIADKIAASY